MAQVTALIDTLKRELKAHGKTYADVATHLNLSEASVKRLFAERSFTLQRLEAVCTLLGIELSDLVQRMTYHHAQLSQLTREQEQEIADDVELLLVAINVINGMRFKDILRYYDLSEVDCISKLAKLDRLKIIDLLPGNRVKLRIAPNFHWRPDGPIQRFFHDKIEQDFFSSRFDRSTEKLLVSNALLSAANNALLQRKMQRLAEEFNQLMREDMALPVEERHGTTLVMAMRQWNASLFKQRSRPQKRSSKSPE